MVLVLFLVCDRPCFGQRCLAQCHGTLHQEHSVGRRVGRAAAGLLALSDQASELVRERVWKVFLPS